MTAPPIDPIASPVAFKRKCPGQDSVLSRSIGAYRPKILFNDEYVSVNAQIANCCVHTPVRPKVNRHSKKRKDFALLVLANKRHFKKHRNDNGYDYANALFRTHP